MKRATDLSIAETIRQGLSRLTPTERKPALALLANYPVPGLETVAQFAKRAGVSQRLEPCRQVDAVAIEIAALDNHIADIDADAQEDAMLRGRLGILRVHCFLNVDSAFHGVDDAGELDEDAVTHKLEDTPAMLRNRWHQDIVAARPQQRHRARFILLHEAAVANHVGGKDGCETALSALFGHQGCLHSRV